MLENSGKPMLLPFRCTEDDIQWAGMSCSADEPCPSIWNWPPSSRGCALDRVGFSRLAIFIPRRDALLRPAGERGCRAHLARGLRTHPRRLLDHIQFFDTELGWISGQALSPLPQDPFLLLTSDGGKTWRQRVIFSESRVGSIQQFHFSAKDSGSLIIDRGPGAEGGRYELYESPDAGETWTIRETSDRPFQLKPSPAALPSEWRARADGPRSRSTRARRASAGSGGRIRRQARGLPAVRRFRHRIPQIGRRVERTGLNLPARSVAFELPCLSVEMRAR